MTKDDWEALVDYEGNCIFYDPHFNEAPYKWYKCNEIAILDFKVAHIRVIRDEISQFLSSIKCDHRYVVFLYMDDFRTCKKFKYCKTIEEVKSVVKEFGIEALQILRDYIDSITPRNEELIKMAKNCKVPKELFDTGY